MALATLRIRHGEQFDEQPVVGNLAPQAADFDAVGIGQHQGEGRQARITPAHVVPRSGLDRFALGRGRSAAWAIVSDMAAALASNHEVTITKRLKRSARCWCDRRRRVVDLGQIAIVAHIHGRVLADQHRLEQRAEEDRVVL
jgi:hypothetical protein